MRCSPAKLSAVRALFEVMVDDELTEEDRKAIQAGLASLDEGCGIPMENILSEFGLTMADFEKMADSPGDETGHLVR